MQEEMPEQNNRKDLIGEIRQRIQFVVTISIFYTAILYHWFNIYDKAKSDKMVISYTALVGFYLIAYIIFEIEKNKIQYIFLKIINISTLIGTGMFLVQFALMSYLDKLPNMFFIKIIEIFSLWGAMLVPIALLVFIIWSPIFKKLKN